MTREEFMEYAEKEIDSVLKTHKNRIMNVVMQAWAEGKKNAETAYLDEVGADLLEAVKKKLLDISPISNVNPIYMEVPKINFDDITVKRSSDNIPAPCQACPNHPSNGGSGICHCTLGITPATC